MGLRSKLGLRNIGHVVKGHFYLSYLPTGSVMVYTVHMLSQGTRCG